MKLFNQFSRENRQSIAGYLYAFAFQLAVVIITALVYFPELRQGVVSVDFSASPTSESVDFGDIEIEPTVDLETLEVEPEVSDVVEFKEFETEPLADVAPVPVEKTAMASLKQVSESRVVVAKQIPKSGFFGIKPQGNRIVYVIDMSISMDFDQRMIRRSSKTSRWNRAVEELLSSVQQLTDEQEFYVYLFCFKKKELYIVERGEFSKPTDANIRRLKQKLNRVKLGSGTDPRESVADALKMNPSCIYLLSDGEFNGHLYPRAKYTSDIVQIVRSQNRNKCPIHTIGLEDQANQDKMISISKESGGMYRFVPK